MNVSSALALINGPLVYKPGWEISAVDHTSRFEGAIRLLITYPANQSERADAEKGYPNAIEGGAHANFAIQVDDVDEVGLYRRILDVLIKIETHEAREFLRISPTYWAPFHPHRREGMARWGDEMGDFFFGSA